MVIERTPYNKPYKPTKQAIEYFSWFKMFFEEENKTPPVHFQLIDHINSKNKRKGVECFRGFGKSTLMRYNILYWIFKGNKPNFGDFDYILLIQETVEMVAGTIDTLNYLITETDLKEFLEVKKITLGDNPQIWIYNKEKNKTFYVRGKGAGQAIRGINIRGKRPNIIILDDIENEQKQVTKESIDKLKNWFYNAVLPAVNKNKWEVIIIGTPIHEDALLVELEKNQEWKFVKLPIAEKFPCKKDEFVGAWEDRFPYEELMKDYEMLKSSGKESSFFQEYMLEIIPKDDLLYDLGKINRFELQQLKQVYYNFTYYISIDPAISEKEGSDYTAISVIGINQNKDWFLVDGYFGRIKPNELINKIFEFYVRWKPYEVVIEAVAFQQALKTFIEDEMFKRNIFFNVRMLKKNSRTNKLYVFKSFQPIVESMKFWIPKDYIKEFVDELLHEMSFITNKAIKAKHDDLLDSIAQLTLIEPMYVGSDFIEPIENDDFIFNQQIDYKNPYIF